MEASSRSVQLQRQHIAKLVTAIAAITSLMIEGVSLLLLPAYLITHTAHETGHGLACVAQGVTVPDWWTALRRSGTMDCKPTINVLTTLGGRVFQLSVWMLLTLVFMWWVSTWISAKRVHLASLMFWVGWSIWNISQPISFMYHLTPTERTEWDPAWFIRLAQVDLSTVVISSWLLFGFLLAVAGACAIAVPLPTWARIKELAF